MRASLVTLKDVYGITGSFIFTRSGALVARELPPMFDDAALAFDLHQPPIPAVPRGRYHLISKSHPRADEDGGVVDEVFVTLDEAGY